MLNSHEPRLLWGNLGFLFRQPFRVLDGCGVQAMISMAIAFVILTLVLSASGMLWFWYIRSQE
jgi:hypothetical protein